MYGGEAPDIRTSGRARRMPTVWAHGFPIRGICALFLYVPERGTVCTGTGHAPEPEYEEETQYEKSRNRHGQ